MDILKTTLEWTKAEVFSSLFFVFFGIISILAALGFWQLGKTDIAKAFILPTLVAGTLLLILGIGLFFVNQSRFKSFSESYYKEARTFVLDEINRTEKSMDEYEVAIFKVIPFIIVIAALLIVFVDKPIWRAICTTTIALMAIIMLIDNNAYARLESYNKELELALEQQ